jgi:hypothetical protein
MNILNYIKVVKLRIVFRDTFLLFVLLSSIKIGLNSELFGCRVPTASVHVLNDGPMKQKYVVLYIWMHQMIILSSNNCVAALIYVVSQEECVGLREGVPYVKVCRYNPKYLSPELNHYRDNRQRKVWSSGGCKHCTCQLTSP